MNYQNTHNTWNKLAEVYEQKFMHLSIYNESYDYLLEQINPSQSTVLDVGCGPANISYYLHLKNDTLNFTLSDVAPNMLVLAKKNIPAAETLILDVNKLNSIAKKFDIIVSGFCIPYLNLDDSKQFFYNTFVLLNNKGLFYISFVDGDYEKSGIVTGSTGLSTFFHYFKKNMIQDTLIEIGFEFLKEFSFTYAKADNTSENHIVFICRKNN